MSRRLADWLACVALSTVVGLVVVGMGGPSWAGFGVGYLSFLVVRLT